LDQEERDKQLREIKQREEQERRAIAERVMKLCHEKEQKATEREELNRKLVKSIKKERKHD
jgi:hypothetical protein